MSENFTPLLSTTDWNEEWKGLQKARRKADDAHYWDERAKTFGRGDAPNAYVDAFIERIGIRPFESVLDMGCGTGALSVVLGTRGHPVIAADFSPGMLDVLRQRLDAQGLGGVSPKLLSWEDDWEEQGLGVNAVDVALASRSLATADMKRSLMLLDSVARRRVCVTVAAGPSPRIDERALKAVGLDCLFSNDFQYAFNILLGLGIKPEVSYIESTREESFASVQEAYEHYARMVADATGQPGGCGTESCGVEDAGRGTGDAGCETEGAGRRDGRRPCGNGSGCGIRIAGQARNDDGGETAERRLQRWLEDHLVENPHVGRPDRDGLPEKALRLDPPRKTTWAYLSWNTTMALGH